MISIVTILTLNYTSAGKNKFILLDLTQSSLKINNNLFLDLLVKTTVRHYTKLYYISSHPEHTKRSVVNFA